MLPRTQRKRHIRRFSPMAVLWLLSVVFTCHAAVSLAQDFEEGVSLLARNSFSEKEKGIDILAASQDPRVSAVLQSMLDGRLFTVEGEGTLVHGDKDKGGITLVLTGETLAAPEKRTLKKVIINNQLRVMIRSVIANVHLNAKDPAVRLRAVNNALNNLDADTIAALAARMEMEKEEEIRQALAVALAVADLSKGDPDRVLAALDRVEGHLHPVVRLALNSVIENSGDQNVKARAAQVLRNIEAKVSFFGIVETIFFGVSMGSVLLLAAIGLAITFGVIGVINMAHGELIMLGAYTTYVVQQLLPTAIDMSLFLAVPAAFLVSGLAGVIIERGVIRFLYGRPLETLLATFGISLILQQAVRSVFSPLNRSVETPAWMSGAVKINEVLSLTLNRISILIFCMVVFVGLSLIMKRTSIGLKVRAVSQNRAMARAMGVRAARVDALTFGLGSGVAGVAGVALSQLTNVGPNLGQAYIIDSFMVVVFGGVGNLWGTLLGGLSLGVGNKFLEPWAGAVLAKIIILVFIILFIQKRPQGIFPQKGRAAAG